MSELAKWVDERVTRHLRWRKLFFIHEESLVSDFFQSSIRSNLMTREISGFGRLINKVFYTVESAYLVQFELSLNSYSNLVINISYLPRIWNSWAISKVVIFSWKLLQDKFPSRENIFKRKIFVSLDGLSCVLCRIDLSMPLICLLHVA